MKIDYAIMSCDANPLYSDFWPIVSKLWKLKFKIEPVLLYFGETPPQSPYGTVITNSDTSTFPYYVRAQFSRFWYACQNGSKISIITDIDMLPLSRWYFINQIEDIPEDRYVNLNFENKRHIYACYHIARGDTYQNVLNLTPCLETSLVSAIMQTKHLNIRYANFDYWYLDEMFTTLKINQANQNLFRFISREGGVSANRIDRIYNFSTYDEKLLKNEYYFDAHSARPYAEHKVAIDKIVDISMQGSI